MLFNSIRRHLRTMQRRQRAVTSSRAMVGIELMEPRLLLSVSPVSLGAVYIEEDLGSDIQGDVIQVSFEGGVDGTELRKIVISGDQAQAGFGVGDVFFDTSAQGLGADTPFPFSLLRHEGIDRITATVEDGTSQLMLEFEGFHAGELLEFSIDVDEVEFIDPQETDLAIVNEGFDPITSGVEFHGSTLMAYLSASQFEDVDGSVIFKNRYDDQLDESSLDLPPDNYQGKRDRTAGAFLEVEQQLIPVAISGHVYHDQDQDGLRDAGEEPISGVLIRAVPLQTIVDQEAVIAVTNAEGFYEFTDLMPGSYQLVEVSQPDGYLDGRDRAGTVDGETVGQAINPGDLIDEIELVDGAVGLNYDFGEILPVSLAGEVHFAASDGTCFGNSSEHRPIANAILRLEDEQGRVIAETRTDANGRYEFVDLAPGTYHIVETTPDGLIDGAARTGNVDGLSRGFVGGPGQINQITLASGEHGTDYDFCEAEPVSIQGNVRLTDVNGDCVVTADEDRGLSDVVIDLLDAEGRIVDSTSTDIRGNYQFLDLLPGVYSIVEHTPSYLIDGAAHVGAVDGLTVGAVATASSIIDIRLGSGQQGLHYDFCEHLPANISGFVYHDRSNDGQRDAAREEGIANARIELRDQNGRAVATATTDAAGYYEFTGLAAGTYSLVEQQPVGWNDGLDSVGTIDGRNVGVADAAGDRISEVELRWGEQGVNYNFGELLSASIAGIVHSDLNADCRMQDNEMPLAGVQVELWNDGILLQSMSTGNDGRFLFEDLAPGTYQLREIQPVDFFQGGQRAGSGGGDDRQEDLISEIEIESGDVFFNYAFCEEPPSSISGFVFQDGPVIELEYGESLPEDISTIRDGQLTSDDLRIEGVVLELRDGVTGLPITAAEYALPGHYPDGPITTVTDSQGFYVFEALHKGNYAVYQIQPEGYTDGIDTEGTLPSVAINQFEEVDPAIMSSLKADPEFDAIVRIALPPGRLAEQNNFSELVFNNSTYIVPVIVPFDGPDPVAPLPRYQIQLPVIPPIQSRDLDLLAYEIESYGNIQGAWANTWHLSIIDGGMPRGKGLEVAARGPVWFDADGYEIAWSNEDANQLKWTLILDNGETLEKIFGVAHGLPIAGDFNGDGFSQIGVFADGQWFIDLDGDGQWDIHDLWAKLGHRGDLPVTGDWDGDGKHDIGIYGLAWPGDPRAIGREAGLPDRGRELKDQPENLPSAQERDQQQQRTLKHSAHGRTRSDSIDHVFHFGAVGDRPVAGDWNGDGVATIGVFAGGRWHLDSDGDGEFNDVDEEKTFGAVGDIPVVGDFNGDGIDELGVYRGTQFILDTNRNFRIDDGDKVLPAPPGRPVVGDWDGDGIDDVGVVEQSIRFVEVDPR